MNSSFITRFVLLLVSGILVLGTARLMGQTFVSDPVLLASGFTTWSEPDVTSSGSGHAVAAWWWNSLVPFSSQSEVRVTHTSDFGSTWAPETTLFTTPGFGGTLVALGSDNAGRVLAAWQADHNGSNATNVYVSQSTDHGGSWSAPWTLTNPAYRNDRPVMGTDEQGTWIVAWQSTDDLGGSIGSDVDIVMARSTDNGQNWSTSWLNADAPSDSYEDSSSQPLVIRADGTGHWFALWSRRLPGLFEDALVIARSDDNGLSWSTPEIIVIAPVTTLSSSSLRGYDIAPGGAPGSWCIVVAYQGVHLARTVDQGLTWTPLVSHPFPGSYPTITSDRGGRFAAFWSELGPLSVIRSGDDGLNWSTPAPLASNSGDTCQATTDRDGNWMLVCGRKTPPFQVEAFALRGVGPSPTASLSFSSSNPTPTSYLLDLAATGFTPGNQYFTCLTYELGEYPAGPWFGIDPLDTELILQASTPAPPFNGSFDAAGTSAYSWTIGGTPGPLGLNLHAVTIEHVAGNILRASPSIATSL